jgi:hypothetical protein
MQTIAATFRRRIMQRHHFAALSSAVLLASLYAAGAPPRTADQIALSPKDQTTLAEFERRVHLYAELHRRAALGVPALRVTDDPAEIRAAVDGLSAAIRIARVGARQGDVFTPEITVLIRRAIGDGCAEDYEDLRAIVTEELDVPLAAPIVHGRWPEGAPLPTMPPDLLAALPPLPVELEYRFVNDDLVLRDRDADLIVDILPNAIPKPFPTDQD